MGKNTEEKLSTKKVLDVCITRERLVDLGRWLIHTASVDALENGLVMRFKGDKEVHVQITKTQPEFEA